MADCGKQVVVALARQCVYLISEQCKLTVAAAILVVSLKVTAAFLAEATLPTSCQSLAVALAGGHIACRRHTATHVTSTGLALYSFAEISVDKLPRLLVYGTQVIRLPKSQNINVSGHIFEISGDNSA